MFFRLSNWGGGLRARGLDLFLFLRITVLDLRSARVDVEIIVSGSVGVGRLKARNVKGSLQPFNLVVPFHQSIKYLWIKGAGAVGIQPTVLSRFYNLIQQCQLGFNSKSDLSRHMRLRAREANFSD